MEGCEEGYRWQNDIGNTVDEAGMRWRNGIEVRGILTDDQDKA